ncbi:MAG: ATP-binding protein [Deltaproteobacteria bacterium]|jgi:predicted AAA+ superfamily ATPase|nr:ATP-binding protein [Deltaproteobacteria bacterium]
MIKRILSEKITALSKKFPVITITGPRQSGKTTLVKSVFKGYEYISLEDPDEREFAISDPRGFLRRLPESVILDEIQRTPTLFSYIQGIVDEKYVPGRFIFTGSNQFHLIKNITQTLAGRTAVVNLFPFSLTELLSKPAFNPISIEFLTETGKCVKPPLNIEDYLFKGFYPPVYDKGYEPYDWFSGYYRTYVERDVREIANIANLEAFQKFIHLCAGRCGQILNLSSLASDAGISHTTARSWISVLEASFIVHILPPHHSNFSKRIIKSPKLYFLDTGLLCYLLRIKTPDEVLTHSMKGQIFENFVFLELFKSFANIGEISPLYFWRDKTGHEIDFIIDGGKKLIPIEAKSGETIAGSFYDGLKFFKNLGGKDVSKTGVLIHGGNALYKRNEISTIPWHCI